MSPDSAVNPAPWNGGSAHKAWTDGGRETAVVNNPDQTLAAQHAVSRRVRLSDGPAPHTHGPARGTGPRRANQPGRAARSVTCVVAPRSTIRRACPTHLRVRTVRGSPLTTVPSSLGLGLEELLRAG